MYHLVVKNLVIGTIADQPNVTVAVDEPGEWLATDFEYETSEVVLTEAGKGFVFGNSILRMRNPDYTFDANLVNVDTGHTVEARGCRFLVYTFNTDTSIGSTATLTVEQLIFTT